MKKLSLRFLSLFLLVGGAWAIEFRSDQSVSVSTALDETLAAAGGEISVSAPVDGDAFIAGNNITISAEITEDLWMAGNILTTNAKISDDLRAAGQILNIGGEIVGDVMLGGNTATINASVGGDLYVGGNLVTINGPVAGDANIGAEVVTINNRIEGDVAFEGGKLSFGEGGSIGGNLGIVAGAEIPENLSGFVGGTISNIDGLEKDRELGDHDGHDHGHGGFHFNRYRFLTMAILGALALRLMPNYTRKAVNTIRSNPGKTFLYGLLALICIPFIAIILMATGIGAPIGGWLIANYIFLRVFLGLFAVVFFADFLVDKRLHKYIGNTLRAKIGVVVVLSFILTVLPYVVTVILGLFGIGTGMLNDTKIIKENL